MSKYLVIYYFFLGLFFGCSGNKVLTSGYHESNTLHRQVGRIDKQFKSNFPGSNVHIYADEYGEVAVSALVNVIEPSCHCSPLNTRSFYNLPTIWNNKDPYLDQLSAEIAYFLLDRMDASAVFHIVVRIEKDKEGKSYTSIYRISHERKHQVGVSTFIDAVESPDDDYYNLNLEKTVISQSP
jgi:hypothetical protein